MTEQPTQLTKDDLRAMAPDEIVAAQYQGRCDALLGVAPEQTALIHRATTKSSLITTADIAALAALGQHDLINDAHLDRRITNGESK